MPGLKPVGELRTVTFSEGPSEDRLVYERQSGGHYVLRYGVRHPVTALEDGTYYLDQPRYGARRPEWRERRAARMTGRAVDQPGWVWPEVDHLS